DRLDLAVIIGVAPQQTIDELASAIEVAAPRYDGPALERGEARVGWPHRKDSMKRFRFAAPQNERRRNIRPYDEGELGPDRSFYFRGETGKLNLRAWN